MAIIIKRYQNRKLYNTQSKRYITLQEIEELIKSHYDLIVIDNQSGNDITALTLSQIIFEMRKKQNNVLPAQILTSIVNSGGKRIEDLRRSLFAALNISHFIEEEIEQRIQSLVGTEELTKEEASRLRKLMHIDDAPIRDDIIVQRVMMNLEKRKLILMTDLDSIASKIDKISQQLAGIE